jgi:hypothetical protein
MDILERRYAWRVTYEDPPFIYNTDVADRTVPELRNGPHRSISPVAAELSATYPVSPLTHKPDNPASVIQLLLDLHAARGNPGVFRLIQGADQTLHVVPSQIKNTNGALTNVTPLLDAKISFPERERSAGETLEAIRAAISQTTGQTVLIGAVPTNLFVQQRLRQGAANETARDVLLRTLDATGRKLSWRLLYDPGWKSYFLSVHLVKYEESTPLGGKRLREVR